MFHRAFDASRDVDEALDVLLACGVTRVLTGGGPGPARDNLDRLAGLVRRAGSDLTVMPGGGVRAENADEIVRRTGARAVHSSAQTSDSARVDADEVRRLRTCLRSC